MPSITQHLIPQLAALAPELIIFDKGGTLIDFHGMLSKWVIELARRLEVAAGNPAAGRLFRAMGFDSRARRIAHDGRLATTPMAGLRALTVDVLCETGLSRQASEAAVAAAWYAPSRLCHLRAVYPVTRSSPSPNALLGSLSRIPAASFFQRVADSVSDSGGGDQPQI